MNAYHYIESADLPLTETEYPLTCGVERRADDSMYESPHLVPLDYQADCSMYETMCALGNWRLALAEDKAAQ